MSKDGVRRASYPGASPTPPPSALPARRHSLASSGRFSASYAPSSGGDNLKRERAASAPALHLPTQGNPPPSLTPSRVARTPKNLSKEQAITGLFYKAITALQSGARTAASLLNPRLSSTQGFSAAGVAGGGISLLAYSYMVISNFAKTVEAFRTGQHKVGATHLTLSIGSGSAAVSALNSTMKATQQLWKVGGGFLTTAAGAAMVGIGSVIAVAFESLAIRNLMKAEDDLKASFVDQAQPTSEESIELAKIQDQKRYATLKLVGAIAFGALQMALALGTGGISVGVMLAITLGYMAFTYTAETLYIYQQQAKEALNNTEIQLAPT